MGVGGRPSKQLPPYSELDPNKVLEQRFPIEEAEATLLDILTPHLSESCKAQLTEQRRMVSGIGRLISDVFYNGELVHIRKAADRNPVVAKLHPHEVEWHTTAGLKQRGIRRCRAGPPGTLPRRPSCSRSWSVSTRPTAAGLR